MMRRNIVLIGMPGCGKSTLGRRLARRLKMDFIDTDDLLRARIGRKSLGGIHSELGTSGYRRAEEEAVCGLRCRGTVIATGGSVVLSRRSMMHLRRGATVVYIDVPCRFLQNRVGDLQARGVLMGRAQTFGDLFRNRRPLYTRYADIIFQPRRLNPSRSTEILAGLLTFLPSHPVQNLELNPYIHNG